MESAKVADLEILDAELLSKIASSRAELERDKKFSFPDTIEVEARIEKVGRSSATMLYRVTSQRHQLEAARGRGVVVWYDYAAGKSVPISDESRTRWAAASSVSPSWRAACVCRVSSGRSFFPCEASSA